MSYLVLSPNKETNISNQRHTEVTAAAVPRCLLEAEDEDAAAPATCRIIKYIFIIKLYWVENITTYFL